MTTLNGNSKVNGGYYFSTSTWNLEVISDAGGILPGPVSTKYFRVPFPLLFVVTPVIGLAFLMFLPMIGFALFGWAIVQRVTGHVSEGATSLAATIAPEMAHGAAYLTGQKGDEKPAAQHSEELEKLEKEIASKR